MNDETRRLLSGFASHLYPGERRAIINDGGHLLTAYAVESEPLPEGVTVAARVHGKDQRVVGPVSYPADGWVQIGLAVYRADRVSICGRVLFQARDTEVEV